MSNEYEFLLGGGCQNHWKKIGIKKRSGLIAPLFSIYSKQTIGIGEIPDLKLLVDWCRQTNQSIIQLLPMNDVGFEFRPYDAQSTFALDPMYLSLEQLAHFEIKPFQNQIQTLRKKFPTQGIRVDYGIKKAKLELLWTMFQKGGQKNSTRLRKFVSANAYWLNDYALFKVLKETHENAGWQDWPEPFKYRETNALKEFEGENADRIEFHEWLQWQLFEQFKETKQFAASQGVLLLGDLPFLVSRDSADVWAHQNYFKLDLSSGAPPDLYFSQGQRWGMPPYRWDEIEAHGFDYLIQKLKYAENFYDLFRIDHFVGIFRLWTIALSEPAESGGLNGSFDPQDEKLWEDHGRKLVNVMKSNTTMLPCAEDLGVIPECSFRVLAEFGIPGIDIQRWVRDWGKTYNFKSGSEYRKNSVTTVSTHDMLPLVGWWIHEAGTVDEALIERLCTSKGIHFETVKPQLFDLEKSGYKRLRWKSEISNIDVLLGILGKRSEEVWEIIDLHKSSFDEREKFWQFLGFKNAPSNDYMALLAKQALQNAQASASIFSIQLLQDWLSLGDSLANISPCDLRINYPGTMTDTNWSFRIPIALEDLKKLKVSNAIRDINLQSGRC
ncbi:MAG: 4-alpha-glucanotransferase [Candidatus Omnitrophica bacterium]|nr:4-alpha-glucanotransferase [Candidatus Omnitrophota bacterium]